MSPEKQATSGVFLFGAAAASNGPAAAAIVPNTYIACK